MLCKNKLNKIASNVAKVKVCMKVWQHFRFCVVFKSSDADSEVWMGHGIKFTKCQQESGTLNPFLLGFFPQVV